MTPTHQIIDRTLIKNQRKALKKAQRLRRENLGHEIVVQQKEGKAGYQVHRALQPAQAKRAHKPVQRLTY
jgi:hypothetical protein